jgi:hypothetical protein
MRSAADCGLGATARMQTAWVASSRLWQPVRRADLCRLIALLAILPVAVLGGRPGAFFQPTGGGVHQRRSCCIIVGLTVGPALNSLGVRTLAAQSWLAIWACELARCRYAADCNGSPVAFAQL